MENNKTVDALNDLLQINNDRAEGFQKVEKIVMESYPKLKGNYDHMVTQAAKMRTELTALISEKGGQAEDTTTVAGALHRTWIDLKNSLTGDRDESTLENVAFGENAAIKAYESALESGDLCSESASVVREQLESLRSSYEKFSHLEERAD